MIGDNLSHFAITGKLGEGGMGEVYRAQDTKLGREVALKVLPETFARDAERMARFQREAQVLASLNHQHIAAIHGLDEDNGQKFLVLELVEGETLEDLIGRGPVPVDETLSLALQIARALEAAHAKGIIHRDLKPANVKLTANGQIKVLDFGLAKALVGETGSSDSGSDLEESPTLTAAMTAAGVLLGTAAYMSPEQARGKAADRRADVWAFGVLLLEMLTGLKTFPGDTATDVLGGIVHKEPEWEQLPNDTPAPIRSLLERCLRKDRSRRLHDIADVRIIIEDYLADPTAAVETTVATSDRPWWKAALPWAAAAVAIVAATTMGLRQGGSEPEKPLRLEVELANEALFVPLGAAAVMSPDGGKLVFVTGDDSGREMRLRALDQLHDTQLTTGASTDGPYHPFFSPDGEWLGFVTATDLKKIPITGGTPISLCKVNRSRGATWLEDNTIVIAASPDEGLSRVSASGGELQPLTTLDEAAGELTHRWPQALPGGKAVLFTSYSQTVGNFEDATIEVVDLETGKRKVVHRGGYYASFSPSGHLLYVNDGTLFAVPFDPKRLEVEGSPAPVVQDLAASSAEGGAQYSFSDSGTLAYASGEGALPEYPILWVERDGRSATLWQEPGSYGQPSLAPDGSRLSLSVLRDQNLDVWVFDLEREVATRLTFDDGYDGDQLWSPDGKYLVFSSDRNGELNLFRKRADGSGEAEQLTDSNKPLWASSWSSDGKLLAGMVVDNGFDIWVMSLEDGGEPEPFLATQFSEQFPVFSPNQRWIAYTSNESGRLEVYVRSYPAGGGKWQVSDGGGGQPQWSSDGRELFYRTDDGLMVADVGTDRETFRAGKPRPLFTGMFRGGFSGLGLGGYGFPDYTVSTDGQRFVMFPQEADQVRLGQITLVTRWFDELRARVGR
jgi:serine/threonine-protein kinase